jgi:hypothetical protein
VLDISSWSWSRPSVLSTPPPQRYNHSCVAAGHKLLLYGGISSKQTFDGVVVLETKLGRDFNLMAEELAKMSTATSAQLAPAGSQNDLLKLQLQQLLVKRNMEERTQQVGGGAGRGPARLPSCGALGARRSSRRPAPPATLLPPRGATPASSCLLRCLR